ncbi:MAG: DUF177 domain-containing protein [Acidobacteria bacterium]|nr:DUF177 domain-containing protein [Acidobacteriota bacterium]
MGSPFLVPVAALRRDIPSSSTVAFTAPFDAEAEFTPRPAGEGDVPVGAIVDVDVRLSSFSGGIAVRGRVRCPWTGRCRRCSREVTGTVDVAVDERYVETSRADDEAYRYEGDTIDLAPLVHDAVFLELPLTPLCRDDCRGLCVQCGVDLNDEACECRAPVDPRWAKLAELRFDEDSSESR